MTQFISSYKRLPEQGRQILDGNNKAPTELLFSALAKIFALMLLYRGALDWKNKELSTLKALGWGILYIDTAIAADNLYILYCTNIPKQILLATEESKINDLLEGKIEFNAEGIKKLGAGIAQTAAKAAKRGFNNLKAHFVLPTEEEEARQAIETFQSEAAFILRNTLIQKAYTLARKFF